MQYQEKDSERMNVYVSSSNVIVTSPDENDELNQKIQAIQIENKPPQEKRISNKFFSPDFKKQISENRKKVDFKSPKNEKKDFSEQSKQNIDPNLKDNLKKNIKDLKATISKLIWEEERRVF